MVISEITRRSILDGMRIECIHWNGKLEEIEFLSRIVDLHNLPSQDARFSDMAGDVFQHRVNNYDWDDNWVFEDDRLNLTQCEDDLFLRFLCEMIHPLVRTDRQEVDILLKIFNENLEADGYEIYESRQISRRPVFAARLVTSPINIDNELNITSEFVREQLDKCESKLQRGDYDGAITNARSLVEEVLGEIYERYTENKLPASGDLLSDYKKVKDLLSLSEDQHVHEGIKALVRSFKGIISSIDTLSNKLGDRHRRVIKPERHHAKLVVDSAKTITDFLYSSLEYQSNKKNSFKMELLTILDSNKRLLPMDKLLEDSEIKRLLKSADKLILRSVKEDLIKSYTVDSYRQSDIFFSALRILFDVLTREDITSIYVESQRNNQMIGWKYFEEDLQLINPQILHDAMILIYEEIPNKHRGKALN